MLMAVFFPALAACSDRYCSEPDVCWASRADVIAAAERCDVANFDPREDLSGQSLPYVTGEDPNEGEKTNCIIDDLESQRLMVTH